MRRWPRWPSGWAAAACASRSRRPPLHPFRREHVLPELRDALRLAVAGHRGPCQVEKLLAPASRPHRTDGAHPRSSPRSEPDPRRPGAAIYARRSCRRASGKGSGFDQHRHEDRRPLHSLGLVDGHYADGVRGLRTGCPASPRGRRSPPGTEGSRRTLRTSQPVSSGSESSQSPR